MPPSALRFGPFVLDLERLCLRGPAGEAELRPKSFEVLRHLAERPRRVVSKEALIEAVWPDVTVTVNAGRISGQRGGARAGHGEEMACMKKGADRRPSHARPLSGGQLVFGWRPASAPELGGAASSSARAAVAGIWAATSAAGRRPFDWRSR